MRVAHPGSLLQIRLIVFELTGRLVKSMNVDTVAKVASWHYNLGICAIDRGLLNRGIVDRDCADELLYFAFALF